MSIVIEIVAGPGCCFCIADCDSDPCRNFLGQHKIVLPEGLGTTRN